MSHKDRRQRELARLERSPADGSVARVVEDPITIGLDKTVHVNVAKLPAPSNVYDADFAWIEHRPGAVSLFFGKRSRDEKDQLRTRLELRYPPENLVAHFWGNSREFHESIKRFSAAWPTDAERDRVKPETMKASRDHSDWANFDTMAHAGTEASIDFYQMPPSGIARFARGQGADALNFVAVARVQLSVFELIRLLDATADVVKAIEQYLPRREQAV